MTKQKEDTGGVNGENKKKKKRRKKKKNNEEANNSVMINIFLIRGHQFMTSHNWTVYILITCVKR